MAEWRPNLDDNIAAYLYHLVLSRMNQNTIAIRDGFEYKLPKQYEEFEELSVCEALKHKLEKRAFELYFKGERHSPLVAAWVTQNATK